MKIKTLKIFRENKTIKDIDNNLTIVTKEKYNDNTIDSVLERKIDLRIQFVAKGIEWNMTIPTFIFLEENELGTTIICKSILAKPFLLSLFVAIFAPTYAIVMNKDWFMYLFLSSVIFIVFFGILIIRIIYATKDCLKELKI